MVPKSATCLKAIHGRFIVGNHKGLKVLATLHQAYISLGRKSDYRPVKALYISATVPGKPEMDIYRRYTGKGTKKAQEDWAKLERSKVISWTNEERRD